MCTQEINSYKLTVKENIIIVKSNLVMKLKDYVIMQHSIVPLLLFVCELCGKEYKKKSSVLEHAITHSGEPVYKCDICQQTSNTKTAFRHHLNMHEGKYV